MRILFALQRLQVDRGGGGALVAEPALDHADRRAIFLHHLSEGVAQAVHLRDLQVALADVGDGLTRDRAAGVAATDADPHGRLGRRRGFFAVGLGQVGQDDSAGFWGQQIGVATVALGALPLQAQLAVAGELEIAKAQAGQLADTPPSHERDEQKGVIARADELGGVDRGQGVERASWVEGAGVAIDLVTLAGDFIDWVGRLQQAALDRVAVEAGEDRQPAVVGRGARAFLAHGGAMENLGLGEGLGDRYKQTIVGLEIPALAGQHLAEALEGGAVGAAGFAALAEAGFLGEPGGHGELAARGLFGERGTLLQNQVGRHSVLAMPTRSKVLFGVST